MGVIEEVVFTLSQGTLHEKRCSLKATMVDTTIYSAVLGTDFVAEVEGAINLAIFCYTMATGTLQARPS